MSFWKKVNKSLGLGKNNDALRIGAGVMTMGASELATKEGRNSIKDLMLGKKAKDIGPDKIALDLKQTQQKGLNELNAALDTSADSIVRQGVAQQAKGIATAAQDARRNAQRMMAQSGLKGTSIGAAINRSATQEAGNQMASLNSQIPGMIRNQALQDAQTRISAGGLASAGNIQHNKIEGQRSGGVLGIASALAPLAGQVAGLGMQYQGMKDQRAFNQGYLNKMGTQA